MVNRIIRFGHVVMSVDLYAAAHPNVASNVSLDSHNLLCCTATTLLPQPDDREKVSPIAEAMGKCSLPK